MGHRTFVQQKMGHKRKKLTTTGLNLCIFFCLRKFVSLRKLRCYQSITVYLNILPALIVIHCALK